MKPEVGSHEWHRLHQEAAISAFQAEQIYEAQSVQFIHWDDEPEITCERDVDEEVFDEDEEETDQW